MKIFSLHFSESPLLSSLPDIELEVFGAITRKAHRLLALVPSRRQLRVIAGLGVLMFIATGAIQVSTEMRDRPHRAHHALYQAETWSQDITTALPAQQRDAWKKVVKQDPALIVDLCTVSLPSSR